MSEGGPDPLAQLGERLAKARSSRGDAPAAPPESPAMQPGVGVGLRIGVELVVAVVVSTGLGWAIDRWLGTRPWGIILMFFLGVAAGMVNVYRAVTGVRMAVGYRRLDPPAAGGRARQAEEDDEE
jgi:ATP synthase protein I